MFAAIDQGSASIIVACIVVGVPATIAGVRERRRRRETRATIESTYELSLSTNNAVNHVPENEPNLIHEVKTLRTDVDSLMVHHQWSAHVLEGIAGRVGVGVVPFKQWSDQHTAQANSEGKS